MRHRSTITAAIGACAVVVMATGVGLAAAAGGSSKVFSACLTKSHGLTEVTESPAKQRHCPAGSSRVTWNAKGAPGPVGAAVTYIPLFGYGSGSSAETFGCGGHTYTPEPTPTCPADATSAWDSVQINSADFAPGATVRMQVSFIVNPTQDDFREAEMCARLLDVTTRKVVGKPVCATNTDDINTVYTFKQSAPVVLPKGAHNYKLEVAMPTNTKTGLDNTMGGELTQATAVVTS